jgi:hypothetical protein
MIILDVDSMLRSRDFTCSQRLEYIFDRNNYLDIRVI